jgi:hypothetical protein
MFQRDNSPGRHSGPHRANPFSICAVVRLMSSLKGEVKKKHTANGWIFSCFSAHLFEQDLF